MWFFASDPFCQESNRGGQKPEPVPKADLVAILEAESLTILEVEPMKVKLACPLDQV